MGVGDVEGLPCSHPTHGGSRGVEMGRGAALGWNRLNLNRPLNIIIIIISYTDMPVGAPVLLLLEYKGNRTI
ncbi:hypothetical protein N658DRAFT_173120 [Parathielavia hyrcaniae]|uniref:Uncharacterized protein n=1 Tax=Parathielavia hyrcaniae TaxID=113614 RepID=A0AAN6SZD9_9PEZI|nr:hypothetical protein N658DRAFT_173120 [Parathielavia hyrcaniae]